MKYVHGFSTLAIRQENGPRHHVYTAWKAMVQRCHNCKVGPYEGYGARGIKVCKRWRESFFAFLEDMGYPPTRAHTLGRKNGKLGYSKANCRWETTKEQGRNRSNTRFLTFRGERLSVADWAEKIGLPWNTLKMRMRRGWSTEKILTTPRISFGQLREQQREVLKNVECYHAP